MSLTANTLAIALAIASLLVVGMALHYVWRVGSRYDLLCFNGLLAASFGLLMAAQVRDTPISQFSAISFGFGSFCIALSIWREGLRRFRDAG